MAVKSIYLPEPSIEGDRIRVTDEEHRHLAVARVEEREAVEVFDGRGAVWSTEVVSCNKRETLLRVLHARRVKRSGPELFLGLSLIKPAAFELALEKVVEVGVARVIPFAAERSNTPPPRRLDRWHRIVVEAAKQSKRYVLPEIDNPVTFEEILRVSAPTRIVFAERGGGSLKSALAGSPALFLVGPEGGWTESELHTAQTEDSISWGSEMEFFEPKRRPSQELH
jgi:16S rRNA (uracil1498-N3)-methyltransferase